ncbi:hypothetical protein EUGRSUZ_B01178 [Eucalyptus grandis]|uniref:Uncharacterized protein n=2 Tax=Eucalyptus grandis TaxID=71139 RepID=A0ACC3LQ00_EUCGR|nr:hypothetical protein EUGRSUZ_B01178 [Eucalyptus grandis]
MDICPLPLKYMGKLQQSQLCWHKICPYGNRNELLLAILATVQEKPQENIWPRDQVAYMAGLELNLLVGS